MRKISIVEPNRLEDAGYFSSTFQDYPNGCYVFTHNGNRLNVMVGVGMGWEHVSVSCKNHCPTWDNMQFIKEKFWGDDETVLQFHPKKTNYVNNHPFS